MLLTIDIGTSTFKAALWDYEGNCLFFTDVPLAIDVSDGYRHEVNPQRWLDAFEQCCKKLGKPENVQAIIISGNGPSLVPVIGDTIKNISNNKHKSNFFNIPAENARLWLDRRAVKYQDDVSALMGGFVDASFFLPKILYIKNEEPYIYENTKIFLGCPEYLAYALTGEGRTVFPCEGFDRWFWNGETLNKLGLDSEKFPQFIFPGDQFGTILPSVAQHFGFKKNIPVISGGPDFFASILGSGVTEPGQVCDRTGSSEGINLCTKDRLYDKRLMSYGHPVKPYWNFSGIINTTGKAVEWGCNLFGITNIDDFFSLAGKSKPGSGGLVFNPYLEGERSPLWDPSVRALWSGINLSSGRSEFAYSILEGICFAIKDILEIMEETGGQAEQLHITGGLASSSVLNQIKADITGKEVLEGVFKKAELLGLAIIGSCFLGIYDSFRQASSVMVKTEKYFKPNKNNKELYDELFAKYLIQSRRSL